MKLLSSHHTDKRKWDQMVASDAQLDFFSLTWVWDVLHPNWQMLCDDSGNYLGLLPIANKFGISYRMQPFFIRSIGFVESSTDSYSELMSFVANSARYVHLNFTGNQEMQKCEKGRFQQLDITKGINDLRTDYSTNAKRLLKKTPVSFCLETIDSPAEFVSFFKEQKGEELNGFTSLVWKRLLDLLLAIKKHGLLTIYAIKEKNEILAAGAFISYKGTFYFLKGTATAEAKKNGAMYYLLDEVISMIHETHHTLDFVGSNNEAISQFYRKFGAVDMPYSILKKNNLPSLLRILKS